MRPMIRRALAIVRDGWLIIGVTLLLFVALEATYVAQAAARRILRGESASAPFGMDPDHPHAREAWWADFMAQDPEAGALRYDPFRGWWPQGRRSRFVNTDADGRRVTMQPPIAPGPHRRVYMFGGSVMWGWLIRDSSTIPSLVASRIRELGYSDVEVVNLAQSTFDLAQNAATLLQELRHGRVPTVAVFLDGNNEVAPAFQSGELGRILNEALIARRFERRTEFSSEVTALLRYSALVQRLRRRRVPPADSGRWRLCHEIAGSYARQIRAVSAIASAFHFHPIFLWQPMLATTHKPFSSWERKIPTQEVWRGMVQRCTAAVDSALASSPNISYHPLHTLFDSDTASVFTDDYGHVTERANGVIATDIALRIAEHLGPPASRARGADRSAEAASPSPRLRRKPR